MSEYDVIKKIVSSISAKRDPWNHHEASVAYLAIQLGKLLDLPGEKMELIEIGAHLHDVGKILMRPELLKRVRKYDYVERMEMRTHAVLGWEICMETGLHPMIASIARHHHENWDGSGYPDGLQGEEISIGARIVAVCDRWSALTNERSYRKAYEPVTAREIMRAERGKEFDPQLLDLFFEKVLDV